ncbi:MAG: malate dehydrogenase [Candidatus Omnitrophica bacterium]|nr:malate dehydrogenase [Candidatus Omnitrophota bacterium]
MSLPLVTVVGAGQVGATTAHLLALKGLADVVLIDIVEGLAEGKALDMTQAAPIEGWRGSVRGSTDYGAMAGSRLVVITAGLARKPGMSREELLAANAQIVGPIAERIAASASEALIIVVTNPLDVMVALTLARSGFDRRRVMGMAGVLDSARLRAFIAERLGVAPSEVEAMVLGSHGDLMVPVARSITVKGNPVTAQVSASDLEQLFQRTRDGGAEVVKLLKQGSAFYAPASGVVEMAVALLKDTHATLPVCAWLEGEYGLRDVCIGVPAQLGAKGIERIVELDLTPSERQALTAAAGQVREGIKSLSLTPKAAMG